MLARGQSLKWLIIAVLVVGSGAVVRADGVTWHRDFQTAAAESTRLKKPMLVEVSADWCGYCKKMHKDTFADKEVIKHVNHCFVPVTLDADKDQAIVKRFGVRGLPTMIVLSPEMQVIKKMTGYQNADQFNQNLEGLCTLEHHEVVEDAPARVTITPGKTRADLVSREPIAFDQFCLVSMLDDRKFLRGVPAYTSIYRGQTVSFVSAEHKAKFDQDPSRYWPVADGQCVVSHHLEGSPRSGRVRYALIYQDRLWLFADDYHHQTFCKSPTTYRPSTQ